MSFGILSIILGVVLVAGIIFYKKPKENEQHQDPIHSTYRRGMEILSPILKWLVPIFLIGSGVYYYISLNKEARMKREAKEQEQQEIKEANEKELARQIHFNQLMQIVNTPMNEREMKVLGLGFDPKETGSFGPSYKRESDETIELFDNGIVRYLPKEKESYLRVFNEAKAANFLFQEASKNNLRDKYSTYSKSPYSCSFGYFSNSETYFCALSDVTKLVSVPDFISPSFLIGSWGRVSSSNEGKYTFNSDNTFIFDDSREGRITGKWNTEDKKIILNYDKKIRVYDIPHELSSKTEIINVKSKMATSIEGYLNNNEYSTITLSKQ